MTAATRSYALGAREVAMRETRERILRSAHDLWRERPLDEVTLADVASGAGVSVQTVLNHFGGKDALLLATAEWMRPQVEAVRDAPPGDLGAAIRALFDHYEDLGDAVVRWNAEAGRSPAIAEALAGARAVHRAWLARVFAGRLPARGAARERALDLHHAATDVHVWKLWRRDLGLPRAAAERRMRDLVTALAPAGTAR
jgi:AcrR family transcriptional regulator